MSNFVISCGGTGGHLAPGIAIAEALQESGHHCRLIISNKDVDSRLVKNYPQLQYARSPGMGFSMSPVKFVKFNIEQIRALVFTMKLMREFKADAVIGFGGFLTVGAVFAAFLTGVPVMLHEANRRAGRAIRMLAGFARRVYLPPGVNIKGLPRRMIHHCGYPIRKEIQRMPQDEARAKLGLDVTGKLLLILGGSQGATALNTWVTDNFEALAKDNISVYCITGLNKTAGGAIERISSDGQTARAVFTPFVDSMAVALSAADLVVARAGAGSIAEFARCRLPSILVPYPYSADDHQMANAQFLEQQGGAMVVQESELDRLLGEVTDLIFNDWLIKRFRENLERLDRANPVDRIVKDMASIAADPA
ncbi:UDP-N-acetylglucosamine--N-acetylmuramyl-(pentapeptide) pyrophosphoryl-undecaprenol N-acetylglucosamine transferase [Cerasicoccus arenae]|uniref:UDP-N-acetylglucosamine--N-acetylmuramyl-(pentapeptide) pyrophosphoryl-undecaprenol N-acetylglucosamine transferase n=1 Tax=Cerasicoccus arenae TaxID=424488 RepID=A0A8J3DEV0_9BACT|nr:UDP-N-acetylglucosamine--N-acetylmuramyl-(pentapeptide) pyrophosphoryl-undecaprenol N-acetylglucosamine transferase [Cerasicoccus arenae]MBK1856853.1 UDP-N-acetylglucosamine--N-acetylmuramyl-(pentapeptide) pyrophosphoryl-undecaprenol N-acetylglucosamine transferase [Cerasicoccus arenae]GHC11291.1 UDP-N-acetylglucosamine--N-acetylmuramyl-(pentapeptide) pyrophosphoryl-undecaprenol N-acetylglucosamine transferase [Cerasicoccus arenae]